MTNATRQNPHKACTLKESLAFVHGGELARGRLRPAPREGDGFLSTAMHRVRGLEQLFAVAEKRVGS